MRYGYLGPAGTFTAMALDAWPDAASPVLGSPAVAPDVAAPDVAAPGSVAARIAFGSVDAAVAALRAGEVDAVMVPIENSVEGGVPATLDALADGDPLVIAGEVLVPVTFVLAARAGTTIPDVQAVGTHSHAWAQVRGWMTTHLPQVHYLPTFSTAAAAADLASGLRQYEAAVCAPAAAQLHGLNLLAEDIGDVEAAVTRFVLIAHPGRLPEPTGADKTTVVLFQRDDHPGGLLELLEQFATRGVNLTRLESRPTKESMGSYCFSIDIEGHVLDDRVGEALMGLRRVCAEVRFLGSYPRADGVPATVAHEMTDGAFLDARSWLDGIRAAPSGLATHVAPDAAVPE
ncbi:MAG: prephenate dehydratase [Dermatophilaceae bacterium]